MPPSVLLLPASNLSAAPGVCHGFTTAAGGAPSGGPDWARVVAALHPELGAADVALIRQVHGAGVVEVEAAGGPERPVAEADASYTFRQGVVLAVRVADCVPVLLAGPGVVAVAHAGWRGTAAGVVPALVAALGRRGVRAGELVAAIGPHISVERYEVGPEVVEALRAAGLADSEFLDDRGTRPHVDLGSAVRAQLRAAGVGDVVRLGPCTYDDPRFHSHRRDGARAGRTAGVIVRPPR